MCVEFQAISTENLSDIGGESLAGWVLPSERSTKQLRRDLYWTN